MKILVTIAACAALCACTTTGAPPDDVSKLLAVQVAVGVAVDRVVTRDHADASLQAERATRIVNVASALKSLGADKLSTLPQITEALAPLLDKLDLKPVERSQADALAAALVTVALQRTDTGKYLAPIAYVLDEVVKDAGYYLPPS